MKKISIRKYIGENIVKIASETAGIAGKSRLLIRCGLNIRTAGLKNRYVRFRNFKPFQFPRQISRREHPPRSEKKHFTFLVFLFAGIFGLCETTIRDLAQLEPEAIF